MFTRLLVPLDGSAFAERAVPAALAIARAGHGDVELVHVHEPLPPVAGAPMYDRGFDDEVRAATERKLEALAERLRGDASVTVRLTFLTGGVKSALSDHITASGADLVVMSTHGAGGLTRALLGSVADYIVRHVSLPVLLVRPGAVGPFTPTQPLFRRILIPLDGSEFAASVIEPALCLAAPGMTAITLMRVTVVSLAFAGLPDPSGAAALPDSDTDQQRREATPYLEAIAARLRARGFTTDVHIISNEQAGPGILDFATQHDIDLVALSTHGLGGFRRALLGSVADFVIRGAELPVLVFHPHPVPS